MARVEIENQKQWDDAAAQAAMPHVLQSWTWGDLKSEYGWRPTRWLWRRRDKDEPVAAAQILVRNRGPLHFGYIPKGPLVDWSDAALAEQVLADLEGFAARRGLVLLKIDPDVRADTEAGQAILQMLQRRAWQRSFEQIQFQNTMLLDLRPDLDTIMAGMKSKWRYNIRLSARKGATVHEVGEEALPLLYEMYAETAQRGEFIIRERQYYLDVWARFMQADLAIPLLAEVEETPVAMLILLHFGDRAWYMYGASRAVHRDCMPNHRLQWEAIRRAKARGCTVYDLWGAPDELDESDPMWGVYRFKEGFGAEFAPHIGAYDYAPRRWLYRLYAMLRPRLLAWMQRRYW
ncbi:MAG: lipid II:glycine glycyltransferase FemX, partial [Anaerolineales bacterium]